MKKFTENIGVYNDSLIRYKAGITVAILLTFLVYMILLAPITMPEHSPYPYFFLNIDKYGWGGFFKYFIGILLCYIVIGYGMFLAKKNFKKK